MVLYESISDHGKSKSAGACDWEANQSWWYYAREMMPVEQLFVEADKALYDVKFARKNNYQLKPLNDE